MREGMAMGFKMGVEAAEHALSAQSRPVMLTGVASGALSTIFFASLDQNRTLGHASEAAHVRGE